jgi:hypothetical protein
MHRLSVETPFLGVRYRGRSNTLNGQAFVKHRLGLKDPKREQILVFGLGKAGPASRLVEMGSAVAPKPNMAIDWQ